MDHMLKVGGILDAQNFVHVAQAHMVVDPESVGWAGVRFLEGLASHDAAECRVVVPMITDPRGVDFNHYRRLGETEEMADLERRTIAALTRLGSLVVITYINYQTIMPVMDERAAFGRASPMPPGRTFISGPELNARLDRMIGRKRRYLPTIDESKV